MLANLPWPQHVNMGNLNLFTAFIFVLKATRGFRLPIIHFVFRLLTRNTDKSLGPPREPLRGKRALQELKVNHQTCLLNRVYNLYIYVLKLPMPLFCLCMLSTTILLSIFFTGLYLGDVDGLYIPEYGEIRKDSWCEWLLGIVGNFHFKVFTYSLTISTNFGGSNIVAQSPYTLILANIHSLAAQLTFVFLSSALFYRLSQPVEPVQWSTVAVIAGQRVGSASTNAKRMLQIRFNVAGPNSLELIDARFELLFMQASISSGRLPINNSAVQLSLERKEVSCIKCGMLLRHVIDENSPLYGQELEMLRDLDASFSITVNAVERASMLPIFSENVYSVHDGDVQWDRHFEDQRRIDDLGRTIFDCSVLSRLKPEL